MINKIQLQNFKLFQNQTLKFSNLNLLTGLNGMGKSTVIQSFLLLRDTFFSNASIEKQLNLSKQDFHNVLFDAGKVKDVYSVNSDVRTITFKFTFDNTEYFWQYDAQKDADKKLTVLNTNVEINDLGNHALFNEDFCYLSAERIVPKNEYNRSSESEQGVNKFGNIGEYALNFLLENPKKEVYLKHPSEQGSDLKSQVNAWLGEISPEINVHITPINANKLHLDYSFGNSTAHFDPANVGFGITYTLPIIIALLTAQAGDLIIIENPESHLHPRGQSKLAELMCLAAQAGVQIFCETHSDHIFYGTRVAIKENKIEPEKVKTYYFEKEQNETRVHFIQLNKKGRMVGNVPDGFFDQYEINLDKLL